MTRERALALATATFQMIQYVDAGVMRARDMRPSEHIGFIADAILSAVAEEREQRERCIREIFDLPRVELERAPPRKGAA